MSSRAAGTTVCRGADHRITKWIGRYRKEPGARKYTTWRMVERAEGRKVNKNLYEITVYSEEESPASHLPSPSFSLPLPFPSLFCPSPPPPPLSRTVRRVLYSTHREDSHYREQSRRIVRGRAGPRQIVTYFTFFPKGSADLLAPLPPGQMMHAKEMVHGRSLAFS